MTDCEKALMYLKQSGTTGVHSFDLNQLIGSTRSAARVNDLKAKGYKIASKREKRGDSYGVRYFLSPSITNDHQIAQKYKLVFDDKSNTVKKVFV